MIVSDVNGAMARLAAHLTSCMDSGSGLMPGVLTVRVGDYKLTDREAPLVTIDWDQESYSGEITGRGLMITENSEIFIRLYVDKMEKGGSHDALVRQLFDNNGQGLKHALMTYPQGEGFVFRVLRAARIRQGTRSDIRFSAGIEVSATITLVKGR